MQIICLNSGCTAILILMLSSVHQASRFNDQSEIDKVIQGGLRKHISINLNGYLASNVDPVTMMVVINFKNPLDSYDDLKQQYYPKKIPTPIEDKLLNDAVNFYNSSINNLMQRLNMRNMLHMEFLEALKKTTPTQQTRTKRCTN